MSKADELAKLNELRQQGALTDAEFNQEKAKVLGHESSSIIVPRQKIVSTGARKMPVKADNSKAAKEKPFYKNWVLWLCVFCGLIIVGWLSDDTSSGRDDALRPATSRHGIDPTGVFSGNAPMGPSTYIISPDHTYMFQGGTEVGSGTWSLSGNVITFTRDGAQYQMQISDGGTKLGQYWHK